MNKDNKAIYHAHEDVMSINWLRQLGVAGFAFFLVKGLTWIGVAAWLAY